MFRIRICMPFLASMKKRTLSTGWLSRLARIFAGAMHSVASLMRASHCIAYRVQRGHQNLFESLPSVIAMTLAGGLQYPLGSALLATAYCIGNYFYLEGYANLEKDVKGARYTHPLAVLKPVGMLGSFMVCAAVCVSTMLSK